MFQLWSCFIFLLVESWNKTLSPLAKMRALLEGAGIVEDEGEDAKASEDDAGDEDE